MIAALAATAPSAQAARPNLVTTKLANPPTTAVVGAKFRVQDTVANRGGERAGRSASRFYLSTDRRKGVGDLLMGGARDVPPLGRGDVSAAPAKRRVMATVDIGTPRGTYFLVACADDREAVRESKEGDNCRAASRRVRVTVPLKVLADLRFDALSDTTWLPDVQQDEQTLASQRYRCTPAPRVRVPGADRAIRNIKDTLERVAGKADYAAFKRSKQYKTAAGAADAAAAAFLLEQPGAALAAMVRAHELQPKDASNLVNAAGLASSIGLPHEALALLDEAERLDDKGRPPMGISRQAVALANRAHALASVGDYGKAVQAADTALAIEPLLAEAQQTAGMATFCAGKPAIARIRRGRKRQPDKKPPLDQSKGKESNLRNLPLPGTPEQAVELVDFYRSQQQGFIDEIQRRNERQMALQQRVNARQTHPSRTLNQKLLFAVNMASADPDLQGLRDEMGTLLEKSHNWYREKWCDGDSCHDEAWQQIVASCDGDQGCVRSQCVPAAKGWHQGWLADQTALTQKAQQYVRAVSKRMSGLASHIGDRDTYELAMIAIETEELSVYSGIQQPAYYWSDWVRRAKEDCVEGYEPPPPTDGTDPTAAQGSGPCPTGLQSFNFVLPLKALTFKVNCNEIQIGASTPSWIGGFGEVTHNFRTGKTTIFAGAQAGVSAGPLKADFKSGIYVTTSNQGIEDIGMRAGPSTSIGAGPMEISGPSDTVDISFVAAFSG